MTTKSSARWLALDRAACCTPYEVLLEEDHEDDDRHGVEHRAGEYPIPVHTEQSLERRETERERQVVRRAHDDERPLEAVPLALESEDREGCQGGVGVRQDDLPERPE